MKKILIMILLICGALGCINGSIVAASEKTTSLYSNIPQQDSKELMFQDMLMLFLLPHMDKKIDEIYAKLLKYSPEIYPYFVEVKDVRRVNGFRGFHFIITLEVVPTVGPHIQVGKDLLTYDVSPVNPENVKLLSWKHLKDPQKSDFPPNWQDVLR